MIQEDNFLRISKNNGLINKFNKKGNVQNKRNIRISSIINKLFN
jgi:hypothetical protein